MAIADVLLPEFDREMGTTRRLFERLADEHLGWRPHERSRTLGELTAHIAGLPQWAILIFDAPAYDLADGRHTTALGDSRAHILETFDRHAAAARAALAGRTDAEYLARWTLRRAGDVVFTMPKAAVIRTMVLNHLIHHRGQLTVYLRLLGIPLPPLYGPTADEGP